MPEITIHSENIQLRLDRFLERKFKFLSYVRIQKAIRKGEIRINGKRCKAYDRLNIQDSIRVPPFWESNDSDNKYNGIVENRFKDMLTADTPDFFIINKPAGLASQLGTKQTVSVDTLIPHYWNEHTIFPKLVHRLDKGTSGVMVIAKNRSTAVQLSRMFASGDVQKTYVSVVLGHMIDDWNQNPVQYKKIFKGTFHSTLNNLRGQQNSSFSYENVKNVTARTDYYVLYQDYFKESIPYSVVVFQPKTGRMHQIRLHSSQQGFPLLGDKLYGGDYYKEQDLKLKRMYLHSWKITIPFDNFVSYEAPIPKDFEFFLNGTLLDNFLLKQY